MNKKFEIVAAQSLSVTVRSQYRHQIYQIHQIHQISSSGTPLRERHDALRGTSIARRCDRAPAKVGKGSLAMAQYVGTEQHRNDVLVNLVQLDKRVLASFRAGVLE